MKCRECVPYIYLYYLLFIIFSTISLSFMTMELLNVGYSDVSCW